MRGRIQEGVKAVILDRLMPMMIHKHAKHGWRRGCDCEFCARKRDITHQLNVEAWQFSWEDSWPDYAAFDSRRHRMRRELRGMKKEAFAIL